MKATPAQIRNRAKNRTRFAAHLLEAKRLYDLAAERGAGDQFDQGEIRRVERVLAGEFGYTPHVSTDLTARGSGVETSPMTYTVKTRSKAPFAIIRVDPRVDAGGVHDHRLVGYAYSFAAASKRARRDDHYRGTRFLVAPIVDGKASATI